MSDKIISDRFQTHFSAEQLSAIKSVSELYERSDPPLIECLNLLSQHPIASSRIIQIANSPVFNHRQKIYTISEVAVELGIHATLSLALTFLILENILKEKNQDKYSKLFEYALCCGIAAKMLADACKSAAANEAFNFGFFSAIGMFFQMQRNGDKYLQLIDRVESKKLVLAVEEFFQFKISHRELARGLSTFLKLPEVFDEILFDKPTPKTGNEKFDGTQSIVYFSNYAADLYFGWHAERNFNNFETSLTEYLNSPAELADEIIYQISDHVKETAAGFRILLKSSQNYTRFLNESNKELAHLNLKYDHMYRELKLLNDELAEKNQQLDEMTAELAEKNRLLKEMADKDGLTNIYNHRFFKDYLQRQISQHTRYNHPLSLIMLDIDFFKKFNDNYGHQAGDYVLVELATLLKNTIRQADLVARYGGEEFAIVLPETDLIGAKILGERIRSEVEQHNFLFIDQSLSVTISLGAGMLSREVSDTDKLIFAADKKLYQAKEGGRNKMCI